MRCIWPFYCSSVCLKFGSKLGSEIAILRCLVVFMRVYVSKPEIYCLPANSAYFLTHFHLFLAKHDLRVVDAVDKAACVSTYIYCLSHTLPIAGSLYAPGFFLLRYRHSTAVIPTALKRISLEKYSTVVPESKIQHSTAV